MDLSSFVVSLSEGTQDYKVDRMKKVHGWLPRKKWVAIGDSTQTDPESYAEMCVFPCVEFAFKLMLNSCTYLVDIRRTPGGFRGYGSEQ